MELYHWTLKADMMWHADQQRVEALPLVILRIHTAFEAYLQALVAKLVYDEPPKIPDGLPLFLKL
jgi:hypothetical protein